MADSRRAYGQALHGENCAYYSDGPAAERILHGLRDARASDLPVLFTVDHSCQDALHT